MAFTYPGGKPAYDERVDAVTVNRFLKDPAEVAKAFSAQLANRFISSAILKDTSSVSGGAITYEVNEIDDLFTTTPPEAVSPGAEYPTTNIGNGTVQVAAPTKWGQRIAITDESIARRRYSPVDEALSKLTNSIVRQADSVSLSLAFSVVTKTYAAETTWLDDNARILRDLLFAQELGQRNAEGYSLDTLIVDTQVGAAIAANEKLAVLRAREDKDNPVYTGHIGTIAGVTVFSTPFLPNGANALLLDTNVFGGMADEPLENGYAGAPVGVKTYRDETKDQVWVQAMRNYAPYVTNPGAAVLITGVSAG